MDPHYIIHNLYFNIFYAYDLINEEQTLPRLLTVVPRLLRDWLSDWGLSGKRYFGQPPYIYLFIWAWLISMRSNVIIPSPMKHIKHPLNETMGISAFHWEPGSGLATLCWRPGGGAGTWWVMKFPTSKWQNGAYWKLTLYIYIFRHINDCYLRYLILMISWMISIFFQEWVMNGLWVTSSDSSWVSHGNRPFFSEIPMDFFPEFPRLTNKNGYFSHPKSSYLGWVSGRLATKCENL